MPNKWKKSCPYWVWSEGSNVHVTQSQNWFTDYTPFRTKVRRPDGKELAAVGVGTTYLSMRRENGGPAEFDVFKMENVLHVPSASGNVVGEMLDELKIKYDVTPAGRESTAIVNKTTASVSCYLHTGWEDLRLLRVAVDVKTQCDPERGYGWLKSISEKLTSYTWLEADRAKWLNHKKAVTSVHHETPVVAPAFVMSTVYSPRASLASPAKGGSNQTNQTNQTSQKAQTNQKAQTSQTNQVKQVTQANKKNEAKLKSALKDWAAHTSPKPSTHKPTPARSDKGNIGKEPLDDTEVAWMLRNFCTEYEFFCEHGLFINSEIDWQKGRHILRAMIDSESDQSGQSGRSESMHCSSDGDPGEAMGFYEEQLTFFEEEWLKKHFGSEDHFFEHYSLSTGDRAQRHCGLHLIRAMMAAGYPQLDSASMGGEKTPQAVAASTAAEEISLMDLMGKGEACGMPASLQTPSEPYYQPAFSLLD